MATYRLKLLTPRQMGTRPRIADCCIFIQSMRSSPANLLHAHDANAQVRGGDLCGLPSLVEGSVQAGFPSPAEDLGAKRIDLNQQLIAHPQATFLMRVRGESMRDAGIYDGDTLVVDRAIPPKHGHIVVAVVDGELLCKQLLMRFGRMRLRAANPGFPDILPRDGQTVEVWGVVAHVIRSLPV